MATETQMAGERA